MKIYIAAKYARRTELQSAMKALQSAGHECTSTWLTQETEMTRENAIMDLRDVERAEAILFFSEENGSGYMTGGRHVEFGYALALGKSVFVVGCKENIFHLLPQLTHFDSLEAFLAQLIAARQQAQQ